MRNKNLKIYMMAGNFEFFSLQFYLVYYNTRKYNQSFLNSRSKENLTLISVCMSRGNPHMIEIFFPLCFFGPHSSSNLNIFHISSPLKMRINFTKSMLFYFNHSFFFSAQSLLSQFVHQCIKYVDLCHVRLKPK